MNTDKKKMDTDILFRAAKHFSSSVSSVTIRVITFKPFGIDAGRDAIRGTRMDTG